MSTKAKLENPQSELSLIDETLNGRIHFISEQINTIELLQIKLEENLGPILYESFFDEREVLQKKEYEKTFATFVGQTQIGKNLSKGFNEIDSLGCQLNRMEERLTFKYDREADILYVNRKLPYSEQESDELGDDVIVRRNPKSGEVENIEILFFSTRLLRNNEIEVPISFAVSKNDHLTL